MNLNELRDRAYKCACEHGFHDQEYPDYHWLMLTICELGEAVEADRQNRHADRGMFERMLEHPILKVDADTDITFNAVFKHCVKDTVEDELADVVIRLLDFAGLKGIDLTDLQHGVDNEFEGMIEEAFNADESNLVISAYSVASILTNPYTEDPNDTVMMSMAGVMIHALQNSIDLEWHIEQKMRYNELRPHLNGKKY